MTKEEFEKQYALAKEVVAKWPLWKQNILELMASPTVSVARKPVFNGQSCPKCGHNS